jgi:hypothetical protein
MTFTEVPTQSLRKSTSAMRGMSAGRVAAKAMVASAVSPRKQAIAEWATVPPPAPPHQSPWASVEMWADTLFPKFWLKSWMATWYAYPSAACTSKASKRAGKNSTCLPPAAFSTS